MIFHEFSLLQLETVALIKMTDLQMTEVMWQAPVQVEHTQHGQVSMYTTLLHETL